jgi:hypothetical protein
MPIWNRICGFQSPQDLIRTCDERQTLILTQILFIKRTTSSVLGNSYFRVTNDFNRKPASNAYSDTFDAPVSFVGFFDKSIIHTSVNIMTGVEIWPVAKSAQ